MSKSTVQASNRYVATIDELSSIDNSSESGTFKVTAVAVDGYSLPVDEATYFVTVSPNTANEELFRIVDTDHATKTLTYDKRLSYPNGKKSHAANSVVQLASVAEFVTELSKNVDDFGFVEKINGASPAAVSVKG